MPSLRVLFTNFDYGVYIIYGFTFIQIVTIMQFVNLISLLRQKLKILSTYLASVGNPTETETNSNLWETLLQTHRFTNEDNWKDDALHMEEFYQALIITVQ
jgi:hypothetical protein